MEKTKVEETDTARPQVSPFPLPKHSMYILDYNKKESKNWAEEIHSPRRIWAFI